MTLNVSHEQIFINRDKMVGKDFEAGLQQMKAIADAPERASVVDHYCQQNDRD